MKAEFVTSAADVRHLPPPLYPEVAFAGRSNVGKSSLMNTVLNRKNLVKTGKTPGKTRLLNFFKVGDEMMFVDLPGYGYAVVSKSERAKWARLLESYFKKRKNLVLCFVLVDIRRGPEEEEEMMMELLKSYNISPCIILTKSDKLSKNQILNQKTKIAKQIGVNVEDLVHFSAVTGEGKEKIQGIISQTLQIPWT